ncbi:MAG: cytochrome c [Pseudomonadota bacterium]
MRALLVSLLFSAPAVAEGDPEAGAGVFFTFCAGCHGEDARGNGPMSDLLTVEPPDLTAIAASNAGVFPVFDVVRQIDGRDPMMAHGGEMPLFGAIFDFPDGSMKSETGQPIITAQPIADVAAWLESVQD